MSRAEVERIWLPFVPWVLLPCALLNQRRRRIGLAVQVGAVRALPTGALSHDGDDSASYTAPVTAAYTPL